MRRDKVVEFMKALGCENINENTGSEWVRASCPLAPWFHEKGQDRRPSFGIRVTDREEEASTYHCFACGSAGMLPKLLHNLQWLSHSYYKEASSILSSEPFREVEPKKRKRIVVNADKFNFVQQKARLRNDPVPDEVLGQYPLVYTTTGPAKETIMNYIVNIRGIKEEFVQDYQLRYYRDPILSQLGIIFPIMNREGSKALDLWVRMVEDKSFFRLNAKLTGSEVDYHAPNLWFGNQFFNPELPIILVEGAFDVLKLRTFGIKNVWGAMGPLSSFQCDTVHSRVVYFGFDSDSAGARYTKKAVEKIKAPIRSLLRWELEGCKDAGDCKDMAQFKRVFEKRVLIDSSDVKPAKPVSTKGKKPKRYLTFDPFDI